MDKIVELGFDGIQSLQPSAGMDIKKSKNSMEISCASLEILTLIIL
jgi:hypothetical protein